MSGQTNPPATTGGETGNNALGSSSMIMSSPPMTAAEYKAPELAQHERDEAAKDAQHKRDRDVSDENYRRLKEGVLFLLIVVVLVVSIVLMFRGESSAEAQAWARSTVALIIGAAVGYITGQQSGKS